MMSFVIKEGRKKGFQLVGDVELVIYFNMKEDRNIWDKYKQIGIYNCWNMMWFCFDCFCFFR